MKGIQHVTDASSLERSKIKGDGYLFIFFEKKVGYFNVISL